MCSSPLRPKAGSRCTSDCWRATTTTTAPRRRSKRWRARWTTPRDPTHDSAWRSPPPKASSERRFAFRVPRSAFRAVRAASVVIDLHVHTTASDGRLAPAEVVRAAVERDLSAIAITDHDVLSGLDEALDAASDSHLEVVAGIEMT